MSDSKAAHGVCQQTDVRIDGSPCIWAVSLKVSDNFSLSVVPTSLKLIGHQLTHYHDALKKRI